MGRASEHHILMVLSILALVMSVGSLVIWLPPARDVSAPTLITVGATQLVLVGAFGLTTLRAQMGRFAKVALATLAIWAGVATIPLAPHRVAVNDTAAPLSGSRIHSTTTMDLPTTIVGWFFSDRRTAGPAGGTLLPSTPNRLIAAQATAAAAAYLGDCAARTGRHPTITAVLAESPLRVGDRLLAVNGHSVLTTEELLGVAAAIPTGEQIEITVHRGGSQDGTATYCGDRALTAAQFTAGATSIVTATGNGRPTLGVMANPDSASIAVDAGGLAGAAYPAKTIGNSAGLALALATLEAAGRLDPPGPVAVTGAIDSTGRVGPVGAVDRKYRAAVDAGVCAFVLPVSGEQPDSGPVPVYGARTLADAVDIIEHLDCG